MKKYIVLSVNDNPEYLFYLPLTVWAWRKFGWGVIFIRTEGTKLSGWLWDRCHPDIEVIIKNNNYPSEMIAQVSRLYATCSIRDVEDVYVMTGDIDMIPLSDYWSPNMNTITTWGHDLTDYQHYPICYIGMPVNMWRAVMRIYSTDYNALINRDLDSMPNAKSEDPVKRWVVDQDLITERLNNCGLPITKVDRGMYANGYPIGRVDRSAWSLNHDQFIDCHMPRGIYSNQSRMDEMMELLEKIWPNEDFGWFVDYKYEFKKLVNG